MHRRVLVVVAVGQVEDVLQADVVTAAQRRPDGPERAIAAVVAGVEKDRRAILAALQNVRHILPRV